MLAELSLFSQAIILFAALVLLTSFIMLGQTRTMPLIFTFAWQGLLLAVVTVLVAHVSKHPHLYVSAALTVGLKVVLIPWLLHRLSVQLNMQYDSEELAHPSLLLLGGAALVIFSYYVSLPIVHLSGLATRNTIAVSIAVELIGMLLIVELGVAFDVLVAAILFGVFFIHLRDSLDSLDVNRLNRLSEADDAVPLPETISAPPTGTHS